MAIARTVVQLLVTPSHFGSQVCSWLSFLGILTKSLLDFVAGTSVSVYGIFSCLNPGTLSATYTVDGATIPQTYNATSLFLTVDREEAPNFLYYSLDNLSAGDHTLVVNITAANNQTFILDYITYTPSFATLSLMPLLSNTMSTTTSTR